MKLRCFLGAFGLVLCWQLDGWTQDRTPLLLLGEATTRCEGLPVGLGYSDWVEQFLTLAGREDVQVINAAAPEHTAESAQALLSDYVDNRPAIVALHFGHNEVLEGTPEKFIESYASRAPDRRDPVEAEALVRKAIEFKENPPSVFYATLGRALAYQGKFDEAIGAQATAIRMEKPDERQRRIDRLLLYLEGKVD